MRGAARRRRARRLRIERRQHDERHSYDDDRDHDDHGRHEARRRFHRRRGRSAEGRDHVVLAVTSDVADEIHLHGYDKKTDVAAGGTARLPFVATIPGRFEVELESRGVQIADLTVDQ